MDERIVDIFAKELNSEEKIALLREISLDEGLKKQYIELKNQQALLSLSGYAAANESKIGILYKQLQDRLKRRKLYKGMAACLKYAAVFVLLVTVTYKVTLEINPYRTMAEAVNTLYVPEGQRVRHTLQDGTIVWLNAQSSLSYPAIFFGKERRVTVTGEAYFEVAEDAEKPFVVASQNIELKVLGTTFNIRSYPKEKFIQASLIEGKLQVSDIQGGCFEPLKLIENDRLTINGSEIFRDTIPHKDYFLWREGIHSFEKEPLTDILKKLETYYNVTFVVNDPTAFQWEYTGKLRQRDGLEAILRAFRKLHKFKVMKDEENDIITLSK